MKVMSRQQAFDLAWSAPMRDLAGDLGISDVGLRKTLTKAGIPIPPQGHWNRVRAGHAVRRPSLPFREPGMADIVNLGGRDRYARLPIDGDLTLPPPSEPEFGEPIEAVEARVAARVGKVTVSRTLAHCHPAITKLLAADDRRRAKQAESSWGYLFDKPLFESPFEQRRLRLLHGLFLALARMGCRPSASGPAARDLDVQVGAQRVAFRLDHPSAKRDRFGLSEPRPGPVDVLELFLGADKTPERLEWRDDAHGKLEARLGSIVTALIVTGERHHRSQAHLTHKWTLEARERARREAAEREAEAIERERQRRLEERRQARAELIGQARDLRDANDIRSLISAVCREAEGLGQTRATQEWTEWAHAVADDLDPLQRMQFVEGKLTFGQGLEDQT